MAPKPSTTRTTGSVRAAAESGTPEDAGLGYWHVDPNAVPDGGVVFANTGRGGKTRPALTIRGNGRVGIGTSTPAEALSVAGTVESTSGGFRFPDGSVQTSALDAATVRNLELVRSLGDGSGKAITPRR